LTIRTNSQSFFLPLYSHLYKNSIDSSIIFISIKVDHPDLLVFILEEEVFVIGAEVEVVDLVLEVA